MTKRIMVSGARTGRAYLLLPTPEAPSGGLHCIGTGTAGAADRSATGTKAARKPRQAPVDYQDRYSGNNGCRSVYPGPGTADDTPC